MKTELLMSEGNYEGAISLYKEHLAQSPEDTAARNKLGYAYLKAQKWDNAVSEFRTVLKKESGEPYAVLYLGMAYLNKGEYRAAIETWQTFRDKNQPLVEKEIYRMLTLLLIKESQSSAEKAIAEEKKLVTVPAGDNTIAVCYYDDFSPGKEFRAFQKGLATMLITDLSRVKSFKVVERLRLQALLEEMALGKTGIVDAKTAPRVGRLLGAQNLIVGSLSKGSIRAVTSLSQTNQNRVKGTDSAGTELDEFYKLPGIIIKGVVDMLGIKLSKDEMAGIGIIHTKSFKAFTYFGQALDELDAGNWKEAKDFFKKAIEADPLFLLAQEGFNACPNNAAPSISTLKSMTPNALAAVAEGFINDAKEAETPETKEPEGGGEGGGH